MSEFVGELWRCLPADAEAAATRVIVHSRDCTRPPRQPLARMRKPALVVACLLVLAAALVLGLTATHPFSVTRLGTPSALATNVRLIAVRAYDPPPGDGVEDDRDLALATDGKPATFWATEWYASPRFGNLKDGVGIVVSAGKPVELGTVTVQSDEPGYSAVVEAGSSPAGPFERVSEVQTCSTLTTFSLHVGVPRQYYMLWITSLSPAGGPHYQAHINEISAS